jgi:NAD(P)-dependent dehydrogenase (short-subunit alcohol dehydrogenase family)
MKCIFKLLCLFILVTVSLKAEQKVVLISGSSGGIGLATVKAFQEKGWKVWAGLHQSAPADLSHTDVSVIPLDVTNEQEVERAVQKVLETDGRIDALINCAGYGLLASEECATMQEIERQFDVNFFGAMRLIQAVLPSMRRAKSGHIINISSTSGVRAVGGLGLYAASKFALEGMSESLAVTVSPWNIKVSIIEPGTVNNAWVQNCFYGTRKVDTDLYTAHQAALYNRLSQLAATGQSCDEIAALIVEAAECENPNMRYQTSAKVRETVAKKLVDPTGCTMLNEQLAFFNSLIAK